MARNTTPSFIVTMPLICSDSNCNYLNKLMNMCLKINNTLVKHVRRQLYYLNENKAFVELRDNYYKEKDKKIKKQLAKDVKDYMLAYGIDENSFQKYANYQRHKSLNDAVSSTIVQKIASKVYKSAEKAIFKQTNVHYQKELASFDGKSNLNSIVFDINEMSVNVFGHKIKVKPVRKSDLYLQEALTHRVKYCRIVRKHHKTKDKYFLQLILEGTPPQKYKLGIGICGLDEGTSTVAYYTKTNAGFEVLAEGVEHYDKEIKRWSRVNERRRRLANPDHFDENNKPIKTDKPWVITKGMSYAKQRLRNAYRLKSVFVEQKHNKLVRKILTQCNCVVKEPMDYKALAKRSKQPATKSDKTIIKTNRNGETRVINKYKRKKRFGTSIQKRSPGLLQRKLVAKAEALGGIVIDVDIKQYRASQRNHTSEIITKPSLSDRTKYIDGHLVQRDLYSAFLLHHFGDSTTPNYESCQNDFNNFLMQQEKVIAYVKDTGDTTKNFGIKDFKN